MKKTGIYLITGVKNYSAYTGDSTREWVKILVPGNDHDDARENLVNHFPNRIDVIKGVVKLYECPQVDADNIVDLTVI